LAGDNLDFIRQFSVKHLNYISAGEHMKSLFLSNNFIIYLLIGCFVAGCSPSDQSSATNSGTLSSDQAELVISGGILLDMVDDTANPRPVKGIVVRNGKIEKIIDAGSNESLPSAENTIDAGSNYIMPGFMDAHVHFRVWLPGAPIWKRASLHYGVTTLFDTGPCGEICDETGQEPNEWIKSYKDFMNSNPDNPDGPTLYITGRRIQDKAGKHPAGEKLETREEIANYMNSLVDLGVDGIKVESSVPGEMRAIIMEEANARGLPVVGHSSDAYETINAGMKFIEHMWPITSSALLSECPEPLSSRRCDYLIDLEKAPALIQTMVDNTVYLNPTLYGGWGAIADSMASGAQEDERALQLGQLFSDMPEHFKQGVSRWWSRSENMDAEMLETHKESLAKVGAFLKILSEAGGRVLAATDAGDDKLVGISLHREMKMLANAGIEPYKVLLGATRWPSEMTFKDDIIGTIEAGKNADIIILGSNPAENINSTRDLEYVIKAGKVMRSPDDCSVIIPPISLTCEY
jgi:imidazolonepropionase-like amidohydrolase